MGLLDLRKGIKIPLKRERGGLDKEDSDDLRFKQEEMDKVKKILVIVDKRIRPIGYLDYSV